MKITKKTVEAALAQRNAAIASGYAGAYRETLRDDELRGLSLVVNRTGASWLFSYRPAGVERVEVEPDVFVTKRPGSRHVKLGDVSTLSPDAARQKAAGLKVAVVARQDPASDRRAMLVQREAIARRAPCEALLVIYEAHLRTAISPKTGAPRGETYVKAQLANLRAMFAADCLDIGKLEPADITEEHFARIPEKAKGNTTAGHWHGSLSRFLVWCRAQKRVTAVISRDLPKPPKPKSKSRWLTADEVAKVWTATASLTAVYAAFTRFLLCVPCRIGEAADLRWGSIDLKGAVWSQAGEDVKNDEPHRLHLHAMALEVLQERLDAARIDGESRDDALKRLSKGGALVFPSPRSGTPITAFSKMLDRLLDASGTTNWSWHDLRRTFASHLGEAGQDIGLVDQILNHKSSATRSGVMGVYQRAQRWPQQVEAMKVWGAMLAAFTGWTAPAAETSNVVTFQKGA
jgi:integrase